LQKYQENKRVVQKTSSIFSQEPLKSIKMYENKEKIVKFLTILRQNVPNTIYRRLLQLLLDLGIDLRGIWGGFGKLLIESSCLLEFLLRLVSKPNLIIEDG